MSYYDKKPFEKGSFCILSNLRNYLNYYGLAVSEAWLGGIIGYMGFFYTKNPIATKEVIHGRSGSFEYMFQCLQQLLENPLKYLKVKADANVAKEVGRVLSEYKLMLVWLNDFYLEYSPYYKLGEFWSLAILSEVQDSKAVIFDNGFKELSCDTFLQAVNCNGEGRFYYTTENCLNWSESERTLLLNGFSRTVARLENKIEDEGEFYGICGIENFAEDLSKCRDLEKIYGFYFQMNRPGGLALSRENMKKVFIQMEAKGFAYQVNEAVMIYEKLSEGWRKIACLLFKLSNSEDLSLRGRIVERVYEMLEYEKKGLMAIKALTGYLEGVR